jgi:hypothetical protein
MKQLLTHSPKGENTMSLIYFDSNVCVGKRGPKDSREIWKSEDILKAMDRAGIAGALVYTGWARDYAPAYGNEKLCEELSKKYKEETFNVDERESRTDIDNLETYLVEKVVDIGDGYFVLSVFVSHPLQFAREAFTFKYIGCAVLFVAWLILAGCIIIYKNRQLRNKTEENACDKKEVDSQYEK